MEIKKNQVSASIGTGHYATTIKAGNHEFISDEPVALGGKDTGPKPHDILLASLAACTCITLSMYASRKGWDLKSVRVELRMERQFENGIQSTFIIEEVVLEGNLDESMRARLIEIGKKCPVHRTLAPAMEITIIEKR